MFKAPINTADCCGCRACEAVCPVKCITMELDDEWFLYPKVDSSKCIDCGKCEEVCPMSNMPANSRICQEVYAAWSKDRQIRYRASSGGMFETLARACFDNQGVVFGAAFEDKLQLKHRYATSIAELKPLCKSKYIQSDISECYESIKTFLERGIEVLFVGTPCQVAAIANYLGKPCDKLVLVDLVCHGVPSQHLFSRCMRYEEEQRGIKIEQYSFRTKLENGATLHYYTEGYRKTGLYKEKIGLYYQSPYYFGFTRRLTLRPSCYSCPFSVVDRVSDITIADFHGIEKYLEGVDRVEGVSMVIVNTAKGKALFDAIKMQLHVIPFDLQTAVENNECLGSPTQMPAKRKEFFEDLRSSEFHFVVSQYLTPNTSWALDLFYSLPSGIRSIAKRILLKKASGIRSITKRLLQGE